MWKKRLSVCLPTAGAVLLALWVFIFLWGCGHDTQQTVKEDGSGERKNVLVAGVDDAGENTDMLMLCSQEMRSGALKILQIPRDTLYRNEKSTGKINRVYRSNMSKYGRKQAAENMSATFEAAFGVPIDGYLIFDSRTVEEFVNLLGGVTVEVPFSISYTDRETGEDCVLPAGERQLSGKEAVAFVRHRGSYAEGDLGRLDAQMRFLCGVFDALPSLKKIDRMIAIYQKILPNLLTNLGEKDIIDLMMAYFRSRSSFSVSLLRLPGEAAYTKGVWYYVLHKTGTEKMLLQEFGASAGFDSEGRFTDPTNETVRNIYSSSDSTYHVLTPTEAKRRRILQKST